RRRRLRHKGSDRRRADRGDRRGQSPLAVFATLARVTAFLAVLQVLIVFVLIGLILMHSGREAGMGGMGFTPASQGGTHIVERNLTRFTIVVAVLFAVNSVALFHYLK